MAFFDITKEKFLVGGVLLAIIIVASLFLVGNWTDLTGRTVLDIEDNVNPLLEEILQESSNGVTVIPKSEESLVINEVDDNQDVDGETFFMTKNRRGSGPYSSSLPIIPKFEEIYSYSDEYSEGGFSIDSNEGYIEVSRAYVWKAEFGRLFNGKIQVVSSNDEYSWYGSRLALVDLENLLIRYEIRLLPSENKLEVRYVDRTNRSGTMGGTDLNTISEQLTVTDCNIEIGTWYDINIIKNDDLWKAQLLSLTNPTCFVEWEDNRITRDEFGIGIQSAGKYVVSRFDKLIAI